MTKFTTRNRGFVAYDDHKRLFNEQVSRINKSSNRKGICAAMPQIPQDLLDCKMRYFQAERWPHVKCTLHQYGKHYTRPNI